MTVDEIKELTSTKNSFVNATRYYLVPTLDHYGESFWSILRELNIWGFFVGNIDNSIYIVFKEFKKDSLKWLSAHFAFINLFVHDKDLGIIVFHIPNKYLKAYSYFLKGSFSKMYTPDHLNRLFKNRDARYSTPELKDIAISVLTKSTKRKKIMEEFHNIILSFDDELDYFKPENEYINEY